MPLTTKPALTGGASAFPYFGNPTPTVSTPSPINRGWGQGWGMYNPFSPPRAPSYIVDIWKKALDSEDYGTLHVMSSDSNIRHHLARALGINVNQLANIAESKFRGQYGTTASKWTPEMSYNYYMSSRNGGTPTITGTGTGSIPQLASPYANMTMLFRDNTGMLHDPGDNPIWQQLGNLPTNTPQVPTIPTGNQWRPNSGLGHNRRNNTTIPPSNIPVYRNPVQPGIRTVTPPNTGTQPILPQPTPSLPPMVTPDPRDIGDPGRSYMQQ